MDELKLMRKFQKLLEELESVRHECPAAYRLVRDWLISKVSQQKAE